VRNVATTGGAAFVIDYCCFLDSNRRVPNADMVVVACQRSLHFANYRRGQGFNEVTVGAFTDEHSVTSSKFPSDRETFER